MNKYNTIISTELLYYYRTDECYQRGKQSLIYNLLRFIEYQFQSVVYLDLVKYTFSFHVYREFQSSEQRLSLFLLFVSYIFARVIYLCPHQIFNLS